jgi:NTE family protein
VLLAAESKSFVNGVIKLNNTWGSFSSDRIYKTNPMSLFLSSLHWLLTLITAGILVKNPKSLLNNDPLQRMLIEAVDFEGIQSNIDKKNIEAIAVTCASYSKRSTSTFVQSNNSNLIWKKFHREGKNAVINVSHLMASVALPLIFPAKIIEHQYFGDGAMRQATPLSPAIRLGADKLLIITTNETHRDIKPKQKKPIHPSIAEIGGYMLDALFSDGLYSDLERLDRVNQIVDNNDSSIKTNNKKMKKIDYLVISPSKSINEIAQNNYHQMPLSIRLILRGLGVKNNRNSDLVSFLLFESLFTRSLIELGYEDGIALKNEILDLI